jgi:uncharacterized protein DUF4153
MKKYPNLLWITGIALGWLFDFLFWKQGFGINFAVYSVCCLLGGFLVLSVSRQVPARGTLWLIPLILLFVAVTGLRAEPMTLFLAVVFTLLMMVISANTFLGGRWFRYSLADYFSMFLNLAGSMLARPLSFSAEVRKERAESPIPAKKLHVWPIVRGVVIAVPVVALFASLLASADAIFSSQLDILLRIFEIQNLPQYIFRLAYILVAGYLLVGVILHASTQSRDEKLLGENTPLVAALLGFTEAIIVSSCVAVLFAAFVVIQFKYFFGGQANITVAGFTYAEYARRGFGELVLVAFFSLLLILGLGALTRRENATQRRIFSGLSSVIVVLVMIMLVSAYQRLLLYEAAYGFSRLRTYTHVALVWIGLLLATVVVLEILHWERRFALAALIASLGFAASLAVLNVDGLIVKENVNRGVGLDVPYLVSLSTDSVPALADAFQSPSYPGLTRDAVGAVLYCRLKLNPPNSESDWRSFTISRWQAELALKRVQPQLSGYHAVDDSSPAQILTPAGVDYDCYGSGMD